MSTEMSEIQASARIARKVLGFILVPAMVFVGVVRFTPLQWYWLDVAGLVLIVVTVPLFFIAAKGSKGDKAEDGAKGGPPGS